jgi:HSP20 family protein
MSLIRFNRGLDPMDSLLRLQEDLGRTLFRPRGWDLGPSGRGVHPPVNVFQDETGFVIHLEVPGYRPEDLSIESRDQTLILSGKRQDEAPESGSYHRRERRGGEFSRSLQLPREVDPALAEASCRNGILTVRVPMREEAKPRRIQVIGR